MPKTPGHGSKRSAVPSSSNADIVLEAMRPVVHLIARSFGRHCEVILHDFRTPDSSIVEIAGNLTDRGVGDPVNDINKWLLARGRDVRAKTVEIVRTPRGRTLKTSRTLFRDDSGAAFGCLCINLDVTDLLAVAQGISNLVAIDGSAEGPPKVTDDIGYVVQTVLTAEEARTGQRFDVAVPSDRQVIVRALKSHGVFELKRAVPRIAAYLGLSRATIYLYLRRSN